MVNNKGLGPGGWGLGLALALLVPGTATAQDDVLGIPVGQTPPAVTIEDLDGKPVDLTRWVGKQPVIVEFWAAWCPICAELLPRMEAAHKKYGDRVEFLVIAVAVNESQSTVRRHLTRHPMPFTFLWDAGGNAVRAFQAPATSYVVILDGQGRVVYTGIGADQDLDAALEEAVRGGKGR
ncbi:MAG TPA: TlpA disulfide reductase family protein [Gemmatimonadales bacterium]|jgi:thiol-disulfide isomerase/thioredoxin|nr:TlpA disulfide reductase family protein [Gemmatimonadales bacterium]